MLVECLWGSLSVRNHALSDAFLFPFGERIIRAVLKGLRLKQRERLRQEIETVSRIFAISISCAREAIRSLHCLQTSKSYSGILDGFRIGVLARYLMAFRGWLWRGHG